MIWLVATNLKIQTPIVNAFFSYYNMLMFLFFGGVSELHLDIIYLIFFILLGLQNRLYQLPAIMGFCFPVFFKTLTHLRWFDLRFCLLRGLLKTIEGFMSVQRLPFGLLRASYMSHTA